jgi:hypothetical protein
LHKLKISFLVEDNKTVEESEKQPKKKKKENFRYAHDYPFSIQKIHEESSSLIKGKEELMDKVTFHLEGTEVDPEKKCYHCKWDANCKKAIRGKGNFLRHLQAHSKSDYAKQLLKVLKIANETENNFPREPRYHLPPIHSVQRITDIPKLE